MHTNTHRYTCADKHKQKASEETTQKKSSSSSFPKPKSFSTNLKSQRVQTLKKINIKLTMEKSVLPVGLLTNTDNLRIAEANRDTGALVLIWPAT